MEFHVTTTDLVRLARNTPSEAVDRYLLNPELPAYVFESDQVQHDRFRSEVADLLSVDVTSIAIVGSASLGFSAKPGDDAFGRPFGPDSDIDIVVVSSALFDEAWSGLLGHWGRISSLSNQTRSEYKRHHKYVFRGWIYPEAFPQMVPFASRWFHSLQRLSRRATSEGYPIRARLYRTWMHARAYHLNGAAEIGKE